MIQSIYFYHEKCTEGLSKLKLVYRREQPHCLCLEYYDVLQWPSIYQKRLTSKMSQEDLIQLLKEVQTHA